MAFRNLLARAGVPPWADAPQAVSQCSQTMTSCGKLKKKTLFSLPGQADMLLLQPSFTIL